MLIHIVVLKHTREENSPGNDFDKIMTRRWLETNQRRLLFYVCFLFSALVFWTTSDQPKEH